jgi:hypothetical protein
MERTLAGVLAVYEGDAVIPLLRCATGHAPAEGTVGQREAVVHLLGRGADEVRSLELLRHHDGGWTLVVLAERAQGVVLDPKRLEAVIAEWSAYRGGFGPVTDPLGHVFEIPRPYVAGVFTMDRATMAARLYRGMNVAVDDADRDLAGETLHARLPAGYDPRRPAGLLVWSSPTPEGRPPRILAAVLDELGVICVGMDGAGNARDVPDKFQLVFDAVATARRRWHVDPRRVYIAGLSGGGKVSSILTFCFPDVFAGAVPIVGFGCYSTLDESWGRHRSPYFARPESRRLDLARSRRYALMGGPADFNYDEMVERRRRLMDDGFTGIRFFEYPDMAHHMPTPPRFVEALSWVDEPYRSLRSPEVGEAREHLDAGRLREAIEVGPWTPAAWEALDRLGERLPDTE